MFPLLIALKILVPVRVTTTTSCSSVGSRTGQRTAILQRGECYSRIIQGTVNSGFENSADTLNLFLQSTSQVTGTGWRNWARDRRHPDRIWGWFFWVLRRGVGLSSQESALDHPTWRDEKEKRPEVRLWSPNTFVVFLSFFFLFSFFLYFMHLHLFFRQPFADYFIIQCFWCLGMSASSQSTQRLPEIWMMPCPVNSCQMVNC